MALPRVNAVVIGAGAGGGVVAKELAEAGLSVVLLERGTTLTVNTTASSNCCIFNCSIKGPDFQFSIFDVLFRRQHPIVLIDVSFFQIENRK